MSYKIFQTPNTPSNYLLKGIAGLKQFFHTPITSAVIILVMTFALFLATFAQILWNNRGSINNRWNESAKILLYLKKQVDLKTVSDLVETLRRNPAVINAELIKADEGIKTFAENTALNTVLSSFKENPLPHVIIVYPKVKFLSKNISLEFIQELKKHSAVETVTADLAWIDRSHTWLNLWDDLSLTFILTLSINALLVLCCISYSGAKSFSIKSNNHETIPSQFGWYSFISSILALLLIRSLTVTLQNHDILISNLSLKFGFFLVLASLLLGFICAKIAVTKSN